MLLSFLKSSSGSDSMDMLNEEMIMTGSKAVRHETVKEINREDARRRPGVIVLRMTWKV